MVAPGNEIDQWYKVYAASFPGQYTIKTMFYCLRLLNLGQPHDRWLIMKKEPEIHRFDLFRFDSGAGDSPFSIRFVLIRRLNLKRRNILNE